MNFFELIWKMNMIHLHLFEAEKSSNIKLMKMILSRLKSLFQKLKEILKILRKQMNENKLGNEKESEPIQTEQMKIRNRPIKRTNFQEMTDDLKLPKRKNQK